MAITRRTFVKSISAGAAMLALDSKLNLLIPGAEKAAAATTYSHYVCGMCSAGCKARAKVVDGVVAELQGENASQTARGRLCVKGLSAVRTYKNPHRVKKPLIRTNPNKGPNEDPGWQEVSWNTAMDLVVDKMKNAILPPASGGLGHGGKSIVMQMRPSPGDITNRLAVALGTPNDMCHHDQCYTSHDVAWAVTAHAQDIQETWAPYTEGTHYSLDDIAGTITRITIPLHAVVYVVYVGTDGKRYTDFVQFESDTMDLSQPINRAAKTPSVLIKPTKKSGRNWTHDIARSDYLISFGWDQPGKGKNMAAQDYLYAINHGAKAVVFDPKLCPTAALAKKNGGEWIQIKPGTDLAVMFAMMKVIVGDGVHIDDSGAGIWNKTYCGTYSAPAAGVSGFPAFIDHIKTNAFETGAELPAGDGSPADIAAVLTWAEGKSGVAAATIERVAREFANDGDYTGWSAYVPNHKRDAGGPNYRNSFEVAISAVLLNTLAGSIDRLGGSIKQRQHSTKDLDWICPKPDIHLPTYERIDHLNRFPIQFKMNKGSQQYIADAILTGDPYPIDVVFVRKYNLLAQPDPQKWIEALNQVFVVCCEIQMSEMAQMADVVLPEVVFLEGRGLTKAEYFSLWPQIAVSGGTVPKLYPHTSDATVAGSGPKGWRDILLAAFPKAFGSWVNPDTGYAVRECFRLKPGGTYDGTGTFIYDDARTCSKAYDDEMLKKLGVDIADGSLATGGWTYIANTTNFPEGLYPKPAAGESYNQNGGTFPVPTTAPAGAFGPGTTFTPKYGAAGNAVQMYSQALAAYGYDPLPIWKAKRHEKAGAFDLYMVTDHPSPHIHSSTQSLDFNNELCEENAVWMNPTTATAKGVVTGDLVDVAAKSVASLGSGRTIRLKAFVTERIKGDVVCIPHGFGHWSRDYDAWAKKGANEGELVPTVPIDEILAQNTPHPACCMTDVVVSVTKV